MVKLYLLALQVRIEFVRDSNSYLLLNNNYRWARTRPFHAKAWREECFCDAVNAKNMIATRAELELYANSALGLLKDGQAKVRIYKVYPLRDAIAAHMELEGRKSMGKILLKL